MYYLRLGTAPVCDCVNVKKLLPAATSHAGHITSGYDLVTDCVTMVSRCQQHKLLAALSSEQVLFLSLLRVLLVCSDDFNLQTSSGTAAGWQLLNGASGLNHSVLVLFSLRNTKQLYV